MSPELLALTLNQRWTSALYICMYIVFSFNACLVKGIAKASFTHEPPSKLYVLTGKNATFKWKYKVFNRRSDFAALSPKWSFYDKNGTESVIGNENRFDDWNWQVVTSSCPSRLLNPTLRVIRGENATLNITDVTRADDGIYGCTLVMSSPPSIISKAELIVTVKPQITIDGSNTATENGTLKLNCSAIGPPTPNITWIKFKNGKDVIKGQGIGFKELVIENIKKGDNDAIYKCNATNNPNEEQVQENITVHVKYGPSINKTSSSNYTVACPGDKVVFTCVADANPLPNYYWYKPPSMILVKADVNADQSSLEVTAVDSGNWTIYVNNSVYQGMIYHHVQLKVLDVEHPNCKHGDKEGLSTAEKVGIGLGVLALVVIAAVIGVICYKYNKKKKEVPKPKE